MNIIRDIQEKKLSRRGFMAGLGTSVGATAAVALTGCGGGGNDTIPPAPQPTTYTDADILNFALNLEYLEAEFYLRAATGSGLSDADAGSGAGSVNGGTAVPGLTGVYAPIAAYLYEVAQDELNHVRALRSAIAGISGATVASRPAIDFTAGFSAVASAATLGSFNPFDSPTDFLLGAFAFEDVGVTAYTGAAPSISSSDMLNAAAGIQAVEGYHAAIVRTAILSADAVANNTTLESTANKISAVRGTLGGNFEVQLSQTSPIAANPSTGGAYARTFSEVLHIVYATGNGAGVTKGGFFPNGMNGNISATTA